MNTTGTITAPTNATMGIAELAERTGVTPGALRTWENRFGFPVGTRNAAGHRRFSDADVALVQQVCQAKAQGLPLAVAVESVLKQRQLRQAPSLFGALTTQFPGMPPVRLHRPPLIALSRAIEDECLARGDHPLVLGAFQTARRFAESGHRWRELARTAAWAGMVAEFGHSDADRRESAGPVCIDLLANAPMRREWAVVCHSATFSAVLSAWEVPANDSATKSAPVYEAVISTQPKVVDAAARVLMGVIEATGTNIPDHARQRLDDLAPTSINAPAADNLMLRVLSHLDSEKVPS